MKAHDYLRAVFDVVIAKAEADPAFAAELLAVIGRRVELEPVRRSARGRAPAADPGPDVDFNALYKELGRLRFESELAGSRFTVAALKAIVAREGFTAPSGRAVKSDWAYAIARQFARRHGDVSLDAA